MVLWCLLAMPKILMCLLMLRARLLPRAEMRRAAAHLGALTALGCTQGFPHPGEFPAELCTQLCKTLSATSLQPKGSALDFSIYGPKDQCLLACVTNARVSGSVVLLPAPCGPFFKSHANVSSELLLSTHL